MAAVLRPAVRKLHRLPSPSLLLRYFPLLSSQPEREGQPQGGDEGEQHVHPKEVALQVREDEVHLQAGSQAGMGKGEDPRKKGKGADNEIQEAKQGPVKSTQIRQTRALPCQLLCLTLPASSSPTRGGYSPYSR